MADTPPETTDPLALLEEMAARAGIFARFGPPRHAQGFGSEIYNAAISSAEDVPALLAALRAVLELHVRSDKPVRTHNLCRDHSALHHHSGRFPREVIEICPECVATEKYVCAHCHHECPDDDQWPCPTVQAITRELGKGAGDATVER
jgi:hypothetical protein